MTAAKRYTMLDALRGIAIINMILYHALWDLVYLFGVNMPWYKSHGAYIWQQGICWTFILLSGFCWSMGNRKWKRGLTVLVCSAIITAVTAVLMSETAIWFGILTLIGTGMLLLIPLDHLFREVNPFLGAALSFLLFLLTKHAGAGYLGFGTWELLRLPDAFFANLFTAYLGFPDAAFSSTDYFPLIPWLFLYVTGYFLYHIFVRCDLLRHLALRYRLKPLEWLGRHSLILYMLHQPVVYVVLFCIFTFVIQQ